MLQAKEAQGICNTCIYRSRCVSLKNSMKEGKPVWYCERFEDCRSENGAQTTPLLRTFVSVAGVSVKSVIPGWDSSGA